MATKTTSSKSKSTPKKSPAQKKVVKKITVKKKSSTAVKSKKVVTKKITPKKTVPKKSVKKTVSGKKILVCADNSSCFWTSDGQVLQDLITLRDALKTMDSTVYVHHVTKEKNDFADWVEYVLQDDSCAEALRKSKKPNTARIVVVRHLRYYNV